jgi:hypothetical protein
MISLKTSMLVVTPIARISASFMMQWQVMESQMTVATVTPKNGLAHVAASYVVIRMHICANACGLRQLVDSLPPLSIPTSKIV